ncbi:hypothetical protein ACFYO1_36110 [Nocardia sp. NPDC006044]|uniref:hypothetical protein n=1 Tax=Nocardia sp. NPDC006044 TaxID=3364306 RepID=UPI00367FF92E
MPVLRRFWIEFDLSGNGSYASWPLWERGVGVTGYDARDCLTLVAASANDGALPPVRRITVDVSLAETLPADPPFVGVPVWRGVWFPADNLRTGPILRSVGRIGRRADNPTPVPAAPRRARTIGAESWWWDEIPHIDALRWPLVQMHSDRYRASMPHAAPVVRDRVGKDSVYATMMRAAMDFMIAWQPTPDEWSDPTNVRFGDQQELAEYLRAFRDYLFGDRAEPIYPARSSRASSPAPGAELDS